MDPYYWLRDDERSDPQVLAWLTAENAYRETALAGLKPLEDTLYAEIVARLKQDDASVPCRKDGYWYYRRYVAGREYPIHARRAGSMQAPEQVLLDANELATGHD